MTKKKVNRVSNTRRPRVPNEHVRLELIIPQSTCDRIVDHCARNNMKGEDFYKKAIYDALPVHYEVTEEFVFPFGKYAGETAGVVKRIDPSYIEWCIKNINGFTLTNQFAIDYVDEKEMAKPVETIATLHGRPHMPLSWFVERVEPGRKWKVNTSSDKFWTYELSVWGQSTRWRMCGYVSLYNLTAREG
jgi:hypothetical protein